MAEKIKGGDMDIALEGQVAVIVGSSSGMGRATAVAYAGAGAQVVLAARSADKLEALASEIGEGAVACTTDARDVDQVAHLVQTTLDQFGRIDILVYATGTNIPDRSLEVLSHETWEMMLGTNLTGAFHCTKAVLPTMREQKSGLIIYLSSGCVQSPDVSGVSYQASKHGMSGLAHGTFNEEQDHGIRTTVIFPGLCDTPLVLKRPTPTPPEVVAKALQPEDVADACLFVATMPSRARIPELVLLPSGL
jgi:NADP-dependent 3-hydroxy acid dehydrogenase YdfG